MIKFWRVVALILVIFRALCLSGGCCSLFFKRTNITSLCWDQGYNDRIKGTMIRPMWAKKALSQAQIAHIVGNQWIFVDSTWFQVPLMTHSSYMTLDNLLNHSVPLGQPSEFMSCRVDVYLHWQIEFPHWNSLCQWNTGQSVLYMYMHMCVTMCVYRTRYL